MFVYVGTYTGPGQGEGIYVYRLDPSSGALTHVQTVTEVDNPSFLTLHPRLSLLYAVSESGRGDERTGGNIAAFAVDRTTGTLTALNSQGTGGTGACHLIVDATERYILVANYGSGHVTAMPLQDEGRLGAATDVVLHEGRGPSEERQRGPHAHFITQDPGGNYVLACDLGIDRVMVYRLDTAAGKFVPNDFPYAQVSSGAGPRHLAFHPSARYVYVINELDSTMSAFAYDADRGVLEIVQTVSTVPDDFSGENTCAQIVMAPSGKFVYGSNRGHHSIAIFAVNEATGRLTLVGHESSQGETPRNFNLDPTGSLLLAANQDTDTIVAFRVDAATGRLQATGEVTDVPAPVCIVYGGA